MPADDRLWPENCNRAEDGREPTIEPNEQKAIGIADNELWSLRRRRSTLSCWRRTSISATSFVLGLKSEAMIWRISRSNSIIKWQGYRVSASRLAESNFRYTQVAGVKDRVAQAAVFIVVEPLFEARSRSLRAPDGMARSAAAFRSALSEARLGRLRRGRSRRCRWSDFSTANRLTCSRTLCARSVKG